MIAVLPQTGQRHLSASGPADEGQSQWVSGCFIGVSLSSGQQVIALEAHIHQEERIDMLELLRIVGP